MPKQLFGHPPGLYVLFLTEMWERFSYYGMRTLLVLYMIQYLIPAVNDGADIFGFASLRAGLEWLYGGLDIQPLASQIYGLYTGLVYLTPLLGGYLADRWLGPRNTVALGAVLMTAGHFLMAREAWFLPALALLIAGNGCFKPNISTQVGSLYPAGDPRRDGAFTIFYLGINIGGFFAPLVCGTLGQRYGWHYGFAAAGVGMTIGLSIYLAGQRFLGGDAARHGTRTPIPETPISGEEWRAILSLAVLATINVVFWAVYEQQGNTLQLFAEQRADWRVLGWDMPSTWFQSLNPAFIFLLTPLMGGMLGKPSKPRSSVVKMAWGCAWLAASFLVLIVAVSLHGPDQKISGLWLALCTLIYTVGELYLSPVGLSLVSKVAPAKAVGSVMGLWFLSVFFGNYLAGYIGSFYSTMSHAGFFLLLAGLACGAGLAIFGLRTFLESRLAGKDC
ncbi:MULTISPECIES: peptide MFS transporter [Methylomonas]|uniref:Peptide ABC transporter n=1 Tax=Methylomonas koyamae TaxID=702114 RepID=A0A177NB40_9GAMM|nr:peptide MFS transporter [Methylomonas koyamae]OAI15092.1 peptide ABC transporter [Methylomonas koyamae]